jgi:hypothetical protein
MTATTSRDPKSKGGLKLLGLGALACLGCCAGPVLAFLGALSVGGLASAAFIGGTGVFVAGAAAVAYFVVRKRRTLACTVTFAESVAMADPTRKPTDTEEVLVP